MKFQRRALEPVTLNLTPLIDVVFLLLIFFMVSTTFEQKTELQMQLPAASNGQAAEQKAPLRLEVSEKGVILLNGKAANDLALALSQFIQQHKAPERVVVIADERAQHGQVTRVLDELAGAGLTQISFQTRYAQ